MRTFTDAAGRVWTIAVNVDGVKRVRGTLGLNVYRLLDDGAKPLGDLLADPIRLADVLYCLCRDEAEHRQVSEQDFDRALYGDVIEHATDAFVEELIDFFPDAKTRASMRKLIAAAKKMRDRLLQHADIAIDQIDLEAEAKKLIASFGSSPESSASTQDHSHSANS